LRSNEQARQALDAGWGMAEWGMLLGACRPAGLCLRVCLVWLLALAFAP
jgi:hypothetical protein